MESWDHRHRFAQHRPQWLGFDAYSRVCMALGMNQMLQSLSYFVIGPIAQHSPSIALISLFAIQMLALLLLRLDVCSDDQMASVSPVPDKGRKGGAVARSSLWCSWSDLCAVLGAFSLPPVFAGVLLWVHPSVSSMSCERFVGLLVTPCFFLHASWLVFLGVNCAPSTATGLPQRLRTVRYLQLFVRDVQGPPSGAAGGLRPPRFVGTSRCDGPSHAVDFPEGLLVKPQGAAPAPMLCGKECSICPAGSSSVRPPLGARRTEMSTMSATRDVATPPAGDVPAGPRDDLGWTVVRLYTTTLVVLWALGAGVHVADSLARR